MRVLIISTNFVWNISHSEKNWVRYDYDEKNVYQSSWKVLSNFNDASIFWTDFSKNSQTRNSILKKFQWDADRRKDMAKANSRFSKFCERA